MATTSAPQSFPQISITNNLLADVDVYDVFNPSGTGQTLPFTYTKLGTIKAGSSGTVTAIRSASMLQAMYTGVIAELNGNYYYQFPVKIMPGTQLSFGNPPPLSYTIEAADRNAMIQSFQFHKFAMANPTSTLTVNLNAAIKTGDSKNINAFFSSTKNFSNCTLGSWNAVMTWLQMFTSGWQGPYFLYETSPTPPPANYVPVLVATLNILSDPTNNSATLNMCSADPQGNPIFATPPQTTTVIMAGDGTMTDANPGADVPVSLTPVWMNVIQTTMQNGVPVASYISGSAVTGTIAGTKVVSSQKARQIPGKPADKKSQSSFDSIFGNLNLQSIVGLLAGLVMLYEFASKKFNAGDAAKEQAKADSKSQEELDAAESANDSNTSNEISTEYSSSESSIENASSGVADGYAQTSSAIQKDVITQTMEEQAEAIDAEIQTQMENGDTPTSEFEDAYTQMQESFQDAQTSIESGDFPSASKTLAEASTQIETAIQEQGTQMEEWESDVLSESSSALEDASSASDALDDAQSEYEDNMSNEDTDSGYDADNESEPEVDEIPPVE